MMNTSKVVERVMAMSDEDFKVYLLKKINRKIISDPLWAAFEYKLNNLHKPSTYEKD